VLWFDTTDQLALATLLLMLLLLPLPRPLPPVRREEAQACLSCGGSDSQAAAAARQETGSINLSLVWWQQQPCSSRRPSDERQLKPVLFQTDWSVVAALADALVAALVVHVSAPAPQRR